MATLKRKIPTSSRFSVDVVRLRQGMVGYYPFSEGSGSSVLDHSGLGNHGTLNTTATWTTSSPLGPAINFAGGNVSLGSPYSLQTIGARTLACWMKTNNGGQYQDMVSVRTALSGTAFSSYLELLGFTGAIAWNLGSGGTTVTTVTTATTGWNNNLWHHVVSTYTPSTQMAIYVDGVLQIQQTTSIPASLNAGPYTCWISRSGDSGTVYQGLIAQPGIWSRALSLPEIQLLYNNGRGRALFL